MTKMTDQPMQRKMRPSEVGYFGKGIPDAEKMAELQTAFAQNLITNGYLAPSVREKLALMDELQRKAQAGDDIARLEATNMAAELLQVLHFKVHEVEWDPPA